MLTRLRQLLELIRFSHTIFALPFALLGGLMAARLQVAEAAGGGTAANDAQLQEHSTYLLIGSLRIPLPEGLMQMLYASPAPGAPAQPAWGKIFLGILLCMVFARSAAMAFNRLVDAKIDAQNPRTAGRHLPAGILSRSTVLLFWLVCCGLFVASTLLFLPNRLPLLLSVPVLAWLCGYSFAKRFTALAHFWLGAALMLSPVCAWVAVRGEAVLASPADLWPAVILGGAVLFWVSGFDILYACQDVDVDRRLGLHSVPVRLGVVGSLRLAALCHLLTLVLLGILPLFYPFFGWIYGAGIAGVALLLVYEHWLVKPDDLSRVNVAFFQVNAVVSIAVLAVGILDILV